MTRILMGVAMLPLIAAAAPVPSTPDLGKAEAQCRPNESGPAFLVDVEGLKDRKGRLKIEVYPATEDDFLQDDNILINQGKTFRRVEIPVPADATPRVCVRLPSAGTYAVSVLHDRDSNRKFGWRTDGIGFSDNPRLGFSKPKVTKVATKAGNGLTTIDVVMNYQRGLGMRPL